MSDYGFLAIVPAVLALVLAFTTRHVVLSLGVAVFTGMLILKSWNPVIALQAVLVEGPFAQLAKGGNAQIIVVITIISGFIYLIERSGGMKAFSSITTKYVSNPVRAQLMTWLTGIGIFFTDSGNSLILGPMFTPIYDKLKMSREKLAFIIDSTSSPVCVLIPIISWGVYSQGLIENAFLALGQTVDGFQTFIKVIPYQFYPILMLLSIPVYAVLKKDWGPMAQAERDAQASDSVLEITKDESEKKVDGSLIFVPLLTLFGCLIALFAFNYSIEGKISGPIIRKSLGSSYLVATMVSGFLYYKKGIMTPSQSFKAFMEGMQRIMMILVILLLAWTLSDICKLLGTGPYFSSILSDRLPIFMLPSLIFIIGAFISISTGSSWGTFAILIPISVPVAVNLGADPLVCIGASLSGGLLGDHASPISDTTILSSMSTGCDHAAHVRTQFPYAILTGVCSAIGFAVAEITRTPLVLIGAAILQLVMIIFMTKLADKKESIDQNSTSNNIAV